MRIARAKKVVRNWSSKIIADGAVSEVYTFGSIENVNGEQFKHDSDIDIVAILDDASASDAIERHRKCCRLWPHMKALERQLLFALERDEANKPISSINLVTRWEVHYSIHKDGDPNLFYAAQFKKSSSTSEEPLCSLTSYIDYGFFEINGDIIRAIQFAQDVRNKFLKTNSHGAAFMDISASTDPLPKKLMRIAAQVAYRENTINSKPPSPDRVDVLEGLEYLTAVLNARKNAAKEIDDLRKWLAVHRGARGKDSALSADRLLLLAELLYDRARALMGPSPFNVVEQTIRRLTPVEISASIASSQKR